MRSLLVGLVLVVLLLGACTEKSRSPAMKLLDDYEALLDEYEPRLKDADSRPGAIAEMTVEIAEIMKNMDEFEISPDESDAVEKRINELADRTKNLISGR
jgi:hypothetical protein